MKFYNDVEANTVVWDAEKEKPLCQFENGVVETEDERVIAVLKKAGYEAEPEKKKKKGE